MSVAALQSVIGWSVRPMTFLCAGVRFTAALMCAYRLMGLRGGMLANPTLAPVDILYSPMVWLASALVKGAVDSRSRDSGLDFQLCLSMGC